MESCVSSGIMLLVLPIIFFGSIWIVLKMIHHIFKK